MNISFRLKHYIEKSGKSLRELEAESGVSYSSIRRYASGESGKIPIERLERIAEALGVRTAEILGWRSEEHAIRVDNQHQDIPSGLEPLPDMKRVPILGAIACGEPIIAIENHDEDAIIPKNLHADFALWCKGDSMKEARIQDGDLVLIKAQQTADDGEIVAANINGEATLKRLYRQGNGIVLQAANPKYHPIVITGVEAQEFRIYGVAVGFISANFNADR